jgi:hypothetical protein
MKTEKNRFANVIITAVVIVSLMTAVPLTAIEKPPVQTPSRGASSFDGNTGFNHSARLNELLGGKAGSDQEMVACPEVRPQICTHEYRPVCAQLQDGSLKTYSNGCTACSDPAVSGYREGACE